MTLLITLDDGSIQRALAEAVDLARQAVVQDAGADRVGEHVGVEREDAVSASHLFESRVSGYHGWYWTVTVATAGEGLPVTVSEVALLPGPDALVAQHWVPWERRVRAGDLGVGDIFPTAPNDARLVPAYFASDDPAIEETAHDIGLGRVHVLSRYGRQETADRWRGGEYGPRSDMARSAPDVCGNCGFFLALAGSLGGAFGVCANDISPADGHAVNVEYGCGAHSEIEIEVASAAETAELVYDDSQLEISQLDVVSAESEEAVSVESGSPVDSNPLEASGTPESQGTEAAVTDAVEAE